MAEVEGDVALHNPGCSPRDANICAAVAHRQQHLGTGQQVRGHGNAPMRMVQCLNESGNRVVVGTEGVRQSQLSGDAAADITGGLPDPFQLRQGARPSARKARPASVKETA